MVKARRTNMLLPRDWRSARGSVIGCALGIVVQGCGGDPTGGAHDAELTGGGAPADTPSAELSGLVMSADGALVVGGPTQLCASACFASSTDAQGAFDYPSVPPGDYKLEVRGPAYDPRFFSPVAFRLTLGAEHKALTDPVILPETGSGVPLGEGFAFVPVDAELSLGLDASALTLPSGTNLPYVAGLRVQPASWPPYPNSGALTALWALNPFGAISASPIAIRITNTFGLAAGSAVDLVTVDLETGALGRFAGGKVSDDGAVIESLAGEGLPAIGWLGLGSPAD